MTTDDATPTDPGSTDLGALDPFEADLAAALAARADAGGAPIDAAAGWDAVAHGVASHRAPSVLARRGPALAAAAAVVLLVAVGLVAVARRDTTVDVGPSRPGTTGAAPGSTPGSAGTTVSGVLLLDGGGIGPWRFGQPIADVLPGLQAALGPADTAGTDAGDTKGARWKTFEIRWQDDGRFSGWTLTDTDVVGAAAPPSLVLPLGLSLGMTVGELRAWPGSTTPVELDKAGPALCGTLEGRLCGLVSASSLDPPTQTLPDDALVYGFAAGTGARFSGTPATTSPDGTVPTGTVALQGDGLGEWRFGTDGDAVVARLTERLGPPDEDSGWTGPGFYAVRSRGVRWKALDLTLLEESKKPVLLGWTVYKSERGSADLPAGVTLPAGVRLGMTLDELRAAVGATKSQGLEGSIGECWTDHGKPVCVAFDPASGSTVQPATGSMRVLMVLAGLQVDPSLVPDARGGSTPATLPPVSTVPTPASGVPTPPAPPAGTVATTWRLQNPADANPEAWNFAVRVNYAGCAGSAVPGDTLIGPYVQETSTDVVVSFFAAPLPGGAHLCPLPLGTPATIQLHQALGTRKLHIGVGGTVRDL